MKFIIYKKFELRLFVALIDKKKIIDSKEYSLVDAEDTDEISRHICSFAKKNNIGVPLIATCVEDRDCFYKISSINKDEKFNVNYAEEFSEFIKELEEDKYVYDYMYLKSDDERVKKILSCAANKAVVEDMIYEASEMNLIMRVITPETASIGNLLVESELKSNINIVVDADIEKIAIRIYRKNECIATHVIEEALKPLKQIFEQNNVSISSKKDEKILEVLNQESSKKTIIRAVAQISQCIDYYVENKVCEENTPVYLLGCAGLIGMFFNALKSGIKHPCYNANNLVVGKKTNRIATMLAKSYGAAIGEY